MTVMMLASTTVFGSPVLQINSGAASGENFDTPSCFEPGINISGTNFTLTGFSGTTFCNPTDTMFIAGTLTLNGVTYGGCDPNCTNNSTFTFTSQFPGPTILVPSLYTGPYLGTFTMTGHTDLAGGIDFVGAGSVTLELRSSQGFYYDTIQYDFVAPEPSVLSLLATGLLGLLALLLIHRLPE